MARASVNLNLPVNRRANGVNVLCGAVSEPLILAPTHSVEFFSDLDSAAFKWPTTSRTFVASR